MKIAISSTGKDLSSEVDTRFGRCSYFIILDPDTMEYEVYPNSGLNFSSGAGTSAAQFVASKGVSYVITGNCGPKAIQVLEAAGIKVITGQSGIIKDVVEKFKRGELSSSSMNMSYGYEMGRGMGGGRGFGRGCGGGFYGRQWRDVVSTQPSTTSSAGEREEIEMLKKEIMDLRRGIDMILERLDKLEK